MSSHYLFPPTLRHHFCPSCYPSLGMLPKNVALYPPEDELVSLSTVYDLLDEQQDYYTELLQQQERNYRAFLQMLMDTASSRTDSLVREMHDLRNCLHGTKAELAEVKKQGVHNSKRAEMLAEGLVTVRGELDGNRSKAAVTGRGFGGRPVDLKGGGRCGEGKKTAPKALKLVADLTDIHFDDIKVVHKGKPAMSLGWCIIVTVYQCLKYQSRFLWFIWDTCGFQGSSLFWCLTGSSYRFLEL